MQIPQNRVFEKTSKVLRIGRSIEEDNQRPPSLILYEWNLIFFLSIQKGVGYRRNPVISRVTFSPLRKKSVIICNSDYMETQRNSLSA